jgi:hypothetical protein
MAKKLINLGAPRELTEGEVTGLHRENGFCFPRETFIGMLEDLGFSVIKKKRRKK